MPTVDPVQFGPREVETLAEALRAWAQNHPAPNDPWLGFCDGTPPLSPREISGAVDAHARGDTSPASVNVLRLYGYAATELTLEQIVEDLFELSQVGERGGFLVR